jgi:hypothetical protein
VTPDLYAAWLTAGDRLQPAGQWVAGNWPNLGIAALLAVFAAWCIRYGIHGLRHADRVATAALTELDQHHNADNARKEDR